ncbi:MAG TPA: response regulator transcription factor [Puia sp.]|nr:response regulator transcription factor [Puia sp.]
MSRQKYKVALADDNPLIRRGLTELINSFEEYEILFDAANGQELIERVGGGAVPDCIILDINMPRKDGYETALWLRANYPTVRVIALSMIEEEAAVSRMLQNGARAYLIKDTEPWKLKETLDTILAGGIDPHR